MPDRTTVWVHDYGWHTLKTARPRQEHNPQSMPYSSAPSQPVKQGRNKGPTEQRYARTDVGQRRGPSEDHNLRTNYRNNYLKQNHAEKKESELRSCMKVEVAVLGSPSLIVRNMVSAGVKQHWKETEEVIKTGTNENQRTLGR